MVNSDDGAYDGGALAVVTGTFNTPITLNEGTWYGLAIQGSSASIVLRGMNVLNNFGVLGLSATLGINAQNLNWTVANAFGALPASFPVGGTRAQNTAPLIGLRVV